MTLRSELEKKITKGVKSVTKKDLAPKYRDNDIARGIDRFAKGEIAPKGWHPYAVRSRGFDK